MRALAVLLLAACATVAPQHHEHYEPPAKYRMWWAQTEHCARRAASFDSVEWRVTPGGWWWCGTKKCLGIVEEDRVYLSTHIRNSEQHIKHLILHVLVGDEDHSLPVWKKCA